MRGKKVKQVGGWLLAASVVGGSLFLTAPMAQAAPLDITVTNLNLAGPGSFHAALEAANAATAGSNPEGVNITFDASLVGAGEISLNDASQAMSTTTLNPGSENTALGAWFVVDNAADLPVSIDFTNLDGIDGFDTAYAGINVESNNVSLSNLANLRVGESGIAVRGTGTTVSNVELKDPDTSWQEVGVLLLDGAANTTLTDVTVHSAYWGSVVVDNNATVGNTVISGLTSRGVQSWGHVIFEDNTVVDGFQLTNSVLGAPEETSPKSGFFVNAGTQATGLNVAGSTFQSPGEEGVHFFGGAQTFTGTVFDGNTFGGNADHRIGDVIGANSATWDGLTFTGNDVSYAGATLFAGPVNDADISENTFLDVDRPFQAALQFTGAMSDVTIASNSFTDTWSDNGIYVAGPTADNVSITGNTMTNTYADASRAAINIAANGTGNTVSGNTLTQDLSNTELPSNIDRHWAIYAQVSAAAADQEVGWTIMNNAIDGFGGKDEVEAPIVFNGTGKLLVTGNTFGEHTNGSAAEEVEIGENWFLRNVWTNLSNHTVQTYRAGNVAYTGSDAHFTAVDPGPVADNTAATGPVTLHVYWTASDHAEEYLGAIEGVNAGDKVSIPTAHTDGFIRVQTVDASGFTSHYSMIDPKAPVVVTAPAVTEKFQDGAKGTTAPGSEVVVRDANGNEAGTVTVDENGNWTVDGLKCGTPYTVVQIVGGVESAPTEFTTSDCPVDPTAPAAPAVTETFEDGASGTGVSGAHVIVRDANGNEVASATVSENGIWTVAGLKCGTEYTVVQVVNGLESDPTTFTTPVCSTDGENNGTDGSNTEGGNTSGAKNGLAVTGGAALGGIALGSLALLAFGATAVIIARRRSQV